MISKFICAYFLSVAIVESVDLNAKCVDQSGSVFSRQATSGNVCGVLCAERVIFLSTRKEVAFSEIIHPDHISTSKGSTSDDLERLLRDFGISSATKTGLGLGTLSSLRTPTILNVRRSEFSKEFDHWVLFLGMQHGRYMIADLPGQAIPFTGLELLSLWEGVAIVTCETSQPSQFYTEWFIYEFVPLSSLVIVPLSLLVIFFGKSPRQRGKAILCFIFVGCAIGVFRNLLLDGGLITNLDTTISILRLRTPTSITESSSGTVFSNAFVIDARFETDFRDGHVKCAVNIPVFASRAEIMEILKGMALDSKIVVYCHTNRCSFSHTIAERLVLEGFSNVVVYAPGWVGLRKEK